jgi:hypothetical protein
VSSWQILFLAFGVVKNSPLMQNMGEQFRKSCVIFVWYTEPKTNTKMAKVKKSWREKLADSKDLPKVIKLTSRQAKLWGYGTMAIAAPMEINEIMKRVPKGKLTTINEIRKEVAAKHSADIGCPITTGIFAWISAYAAEEDKSEGKKRTTPYWRTLKKDGEINPKYPGGIAAQIKLLEAEGHDVLIKGSKAFVAGYEKRLVKR